MPNANKMKNAIDKHCRDLADCIPTLQGYGLTATADEFMKAINELEESCRDDDFVFTQDNPDIK